ncbi:unnamed protein product [Brachionus calyciflorus]|uniref:Glutathione synthetase n=1 Tax=Brachionus calyciflorus TaxID=104777 RepID=A0A813URV7_9BILA|nr:unnamed protein product [Brachionus calyciflorus]
MLKSIEIDETKLDEYILCARDACFRTGLPYFSSNNKTDKDFYKLEFLPFTLVPSPFPRRELDFAIKIQNAWNILLMKCSNNLNLIYEALKEIIDKDEMTSKLWQICKKANQEENKQPITLNIMRLDYLIDKNKISNGSKTALSQVEINSFACGGCGVPDKLKELHKYMLHITDNDEFIHKMDTTSLYDNIVDSLLEAWSLYGNPNAHILLVIRNVKFTYSDHRLIEYRIFEKVPTIKFLRLKFSEIYERAKLDDKRRLFIDGHEIGLIYYRAGFDPTDYLSEEDYEARLLLERSMAIKAPRIEFQLMTSKKFQQYLYESRILEEYIDDKEIVDSIRSTFVKQYCFRKESKNEKIFELVEKDYENWVLKSPREGRCHNLFGQDIKNFLSKTDREELEKYVLMERIKPIESTNFVIHQIRKCQKIHMNCELGVFGIAIGDSSGNIHLNKYGGCLLKSKDANFNEGGIMAGYGAFDSIYFV